MKDIRLPVHIGFIMDGNGRWARRRMRPRAFGHKAGVQNMIKVCNYAFELGVRIVTVYALSTENLSRPQEELDELFDLFRNYFGKKKGKLLEMDVKLNICINYGSRQEIVRAVNAAVATGRFVDESSFKDFLSTGSLPDPDLIIRTGGEMRLSNFLLYQAAYSELYFTDRMWPEFSRRDLEKAIENFSARDRRYGNVRGDKA